MSKYEKGDKFIVEITDVLEGGAFSLYELSGGLGKWGDGALDTLERYEEAEMTIAPLERYRSWQELLSAKPSDLTHKEFKRLARIQTIPEAARKALVDRLNSNRVKVMSLESESGAIIDFLNGESEGNA